MVPAETLEQLTFAVRGLLLASAVVACFVARRRAEHRPVAVFLVAMTVAAAARWLLHATVIDDALIRSKGGPLFGSERVAAHLEQALVLSWPAGVAAVVCAVHCARRWPLAAVGLAWALGVARLVEGYTHGFRSTAVRPFYLAAASAAVLVSIGAIVQWAWRRERVTSTHAALWCLVATETVNLFGAWRDVFGRWPIALVLYLVLYVALIVVQGGDLWILRCGSGSESRRS